MEKKVTEMEKEGKKKKNEANKNVTETTDVKINLKNTHIKMYINIS